MLMSLIRWLEILAFAVFTYDQTKSALWVASLMMLRLLPLSLFGLAMGALASHISRRWLLIVTHAGLFATSLLLLIVLLLFQASRFMCFVKAPPTRARR